MDFRTFLRRTGAGVGALCTGLALAAPPAAAAPAAPAAPAAAAGAAETVGLSSVGLPFFWPNNYLYGLAAASPDSVWISGVQGELVVPGPIPGTGRTVPGNPVVRRWTGDRWVEYDLGGLSRRGTITGVHTAGPENVWINGTRYLDGSAWEGYPSEPYVARFTGTAFTEVDLPEGATSAGLRVRGSDVWLLSDGGVYRRTGDAWTHVAPPAFEPNALGSIDIRADGDMWALGRDRRGDGTVARRFDGRAWHDVPIEQPPGSAWLTSVLGVSPTEAWAVGTNRRTSPATPVVMRWDGASWTNVEPPAGLNELDELVAGPDGTVWAQGHSLHEPAEPGLLRLAGGTWERVRTTPAPNRDNFNGRALAFVPGTGDLWLLGTVDIGGPMVLTGRVAGR
ncbi:hypothetical protein [Actinomadura sp. WAC 06369]|uniref:hypothetical protein n=1 Tax=Actinomadura sp. WAC 06369 TaxID=2203193 RepID=UPI000F771C16|nr:hypothetical protein [Actinomadura sp. WAC 06369]RSN64395.1 hypothetical protein DMH08_17795 [Actinomadura sp. WAC 06369]